MATWRACDGAAQNTLGQPEITFTPGPACETLQELAPLLVEEGLDVDNIDVRRDPDPYCAAGTDWGLGCCCALTAGCCTGGLITARCAVSSVSAKRPDPRYCKEIGP
jgi:hypothetical protein